MVAKFISRVARANLLKLMVVVACVSIVAQLTGCSSQHGNALPTIGGRKPLPQPNKYDAITTNFVRVPREQADYQGDSARPLGSMFRGLRLRAITALPYASIHLDDHTDAKRLSVQTLYLASSLVAKVHVVTSLGEQVSGPYAITLREARIDAIYRHLEGPDENLETGATLFIADRQPASTHYFLDDPPLEEGSEAVVFLRRSTAFAYLSQGSAPVYEPTATLVSKLGLGSDRRLFVAGSTTSRMASQVNGAREASFAFVLAPSMTQGAGFNEPAVLSTILSSRGIVSKADVAAYRNEMFVKPREALARGRRFDLSQ